MQQVRIWEIGADRKLSEIPARYASLEQWIEDWLANDISVLDPNLLIIGRQVRTGFGGTVDLLCMDGEGNLVVVELKKGQTPRDVTSQALEYSSWVKDLEFDEITRIANSYPGIAGSLAEAFRERFGMELPEQLNQAHRSLIVAESVDASTDRIVRYLAEMSVPINVATVQHFEDGKGTELLAQVYLIEPESIQPRARRMSARSGYRSVNDLQALADEKGIGEIYRRLRDGVRGIFFAQGSRRRWRTCVVWKVEACGPCCWSARFRATTPEVSSLSLTPRGLSGTWMCPWTPSDPGCPATRSSPM